MVASFVSVAPATCPVKLYGVVIQPMGWIHQLFLADELRPLGVQLHLGSEAEVLTGDFAGRTGTIKRVLESTDFQHINGYRREGWKIPLGEFAIVSPEPDKLARFQECDRAIDSLIDSWQVAAQAALMIERDELWAAAGYDSIRAYWMAKQEAAIARGVKSLTYERMLQLKGAAEVTETLEAHGVPVDVFSSEKSLRVVRSLPEDQQVAVATAVAAEHNATGRPVTEALVKRVSAEVIEGHKMTDVQQRYAPYGVFKPFTPDSRKNRQYRYIFEGPGTTRLFTDLGDAVIWFDAYLSHKVIRDDMGCPTCVGCTLISGAGECSRGHGHITHRRLWNMPGHCQAWEPKGEPAIAPNVAPEADGYQTVAEYLAAAGFEAEADDMINPDQDPPIAYRGWQIVTDSEERGMLSFSIRDSATEQWYSLLCMEGRFHGVDEDSAIAYSRAVIDRAMALGVKLSGQFSLLAVPAPAVNPQQSIHQRMTASAAGRKEPSPHDENNTPGDLWAPALIARGLERFTLDPMTNAASTVPAEVQWTKADDCFAQKDWRVADYVFMFSNPAFSLNEEFSSRFIQELEAGNIDEALILDKADSRTAWSQRLLSKASLIIRVYGYTKFENADRENGSATFPIELLYIGSYVDEMAQAYQPLGLITVPYKF